jgi:hypothetical protein
VRADRAPWQARVAVAVVLLVALWPPCHRILVALTDANPWKLGGFAMYAAPAPPLLIAVYGLRDGKLVRVDAAALAATVRLSLQRFEIERHALGNLRRPDAVAAEILAAAPALAQISIVVQRAVLDRSSARIATDRMQYSYDRTGPRASRHMRTSTTTPK